MHMHSARCNRIQVGVGSICDVGEERQLLLIQSQRVHMWNNLNTFNNHFHLVIIKNGWCSRARFLQTSKPS